MAKTLNKRFYTEVTVAEGDGGYLVQLDGMTLRTPGKLLLVLPQRDLANGIAAEWEAQTDKIDPSTMPLTRLANVAVEQTPGRRDDLVAEAVRYAGTDLVSYRAPDPRLLRERQDAAWDRWRDWAAGRGVDLRVTESLSAVEQPVASLMAVDDYARGLSNFRLTLFVHLVAVYGSVVLALAVMEGALSPDAAFDLSRVDAEYQIELWGEDEEAAEITAALRAETNILGALAGTLDRDSS